MKKKRYAEPQALVNVFDIKDILTESLTGQEYGMDGDAQPDKNWIIIN